MDTTTCSIASDRLRVCATASRVDVEVSGIIGFREARGLLRRIGDFTQGRQCGVVIDIRAAALTVSMPEYVRLLQCFLIAPPRVRVACVFGVQVTRDAACAHELLMRRRGLEHRGFVSIAAARRWAGRAKPAQLEPDLYS